MRCEMTRREMIGGFTLAAGESILAILCGNGAFSAMTDPHSNKPSAPPGAVELGYMKCILNEKPVAADIAPARTGNYKWFSGEWYAKPPSMNLYSTQDGVLAISLGGDLVSAPQDFSASKLPLLPGTYGFYVEFDVRLSDNDSDHWPAVWLMPAEHNGKQQDHYAGDPKGYERWMELDVDEGGFGPGLTGTVHYGSGIYPHYKNLQNPNNVSPVALDRTMAHAFGASYDPKTSVVAWWVDGKKMMSAGAPYVPEIAAKQRFYLILSAQSHGKEKPYVMYVSGVRAYAPTSAPLRAVTKM